MANSEKSKAELVEVVGKLMALANDPGASEGEKDVATRKAAEIMAKYSISEFELGAFDPNSNVHPDLMEEIVEGLTNKHRNWESLLAGVVARAFDVQVIYNPHVEPWEANFVGFKHDVEVTVHFYTRFRRTIHRVSQIEYPGAQLRARNSFSLGMSARLGERMKEAFRQREDFIPSDCRDIVIRKKEAVEDFFKDLHPKTGKPNKLKLKDRQAYINGRERANHVTLSAPVEAGNGDRMRLTTKH